MNTRFTILSLVSACAMLAMAPAFANVNKEMSTAIEHAGFAAKSKDIKHVHLHLHHVMNCLVGPKGLQFDAAAGDPCKGMGMGILNDDKHFSFTGRADLKDVLDDVSAGLSTNNYKIAREAAGMAKHMLQNTVDSE